MYLCVLKDILIEQVWLTLSNTKLKGNIAVSVGVQNLQKDTKLMP